MDTFPIEEVLHGCERLLRKRGKSKAASIIKLVSEDIDNVDGILQNKENPVIKFTDTNALALKNDLDLSQREYIVLRSHLESLNL